MAASPSTRRAIIAAAFCFGTTLVAAEGREALERLRKDAERTLETTRTWINLDYATSIADPLRDSKDDWTLQIRVEPSTPDGVRPTPAATSPPQ